ncbi:MAG TPA: tRNA guanosine(34) transglycosylase Tgt, partial [Neisseriales bacterium]|nr:tRNA guanosine(34) transglycosylase Tgt [Neisseriales bacterium]
AYLHHLFKIGEILGSHLNTVHNIHYYLELMQEIRQAIAEGKFSEFQIQFAENRQRLKNELV